MVMVKHDVWNRSIQLYVEKLKYEVFTYSFIVCTQQGEYYSLQIFGVGYGMDKKKKWLVEVQVTGALKERRDQDEWKLMIAYVREHSKIKLN